MQKCFLTLPSNHLSNRRSTLTHPYFDTNLTLFPNWRAGCRGQLVIDTQIHICANFTVHPINPSQLPSLGGQWFSQFVFLIPPFSTSSTTAWETNNLNFNESSLSLALDSQTLGSTCNIAHMILKNLSLDNVRITIQVLYSMKYSFWPLLNYPLRYTWSGPQGRNITKSITNNVPSMFTKLDCLIHIPYAYFVTHGNK